MNYRYLDLYEAIEEGNTDAMDNTDLLETDIPTEVPLPEAPHLPRESHEAVKEWVLAVSMDQKVEQRLPLDERMTYEASLITANTGTTYQPCIITGYPVLGGSGGKIEFSRGMLANKEEWNKFIMTAKMVSDTEIQDEVKFISNWCGLSGSASFSFK